MPLPIGLIACLTRRRFCSVRSARLGPARPRHMAEGLRHISSGGTCCSIGRSRAASRLCAASAWRSGSLRAHFAKNKNTNKRSQSRPGPPSLRRRGPRRRRRRRRPTATVLIDARSRRLPGARPRASSERRVMRASRRSLPTASVASTSTPSPRGLEEAGVEDVERADRLGPARGDHHVAGADPHAERRAERRVDARHEQPAAVEAERAQPVGVLGDSRAVSDHPGLVALGRGQDRRVREHRGRRAAQRHPAVGERDDGGGEPGDLGDARG